jgi:WD40 repeat protein
MGPGTGRPDTMIKVFDTRTMQPLPPAAFAPGPSRVRFVPKFSSLVAVISGNTGQLGYLDAELGSSNMTDMYQVATNAPFSCMAASPSGELLAIGDAAGGVRLWTDRQPAKVNLFSKPTQHASVFPVDFNIALDDDSFGTGWVVRSIHLSYFLFILFAHILNFVVHL